MAIFHALSPSTSTRVSIIPPTVHRGSSSPLVMVQTRVALLTTLSSLFLGSEWYLDKMTAPMARMTSDIKSTLHSQNVTACLRWSLVGSLASYSE